MEISWSPSCAFILEFILEKSTYKMKMSPALNFQLPFIGLMALAGTRMLSEKQQNQKHKNALLSVFGRSSGSGLQPSGWRVDIVQRRVRVNSTHRALWLAAFRLWRGTVPQAFIEDLTYIRNTEMRDQQAPIIRGRVTGPFQFFLVKKKWSIRRLGKL